MGWVANLDLKGCLSLFNGADLQAVIAVDGYVRDVNLVQEEPSSLSVGTAVTDLQTQSSEAQALYIDGALTIKQTKLLSWLVTGGSRQRPRCR